MKTASWKTAKQGRGINTASRKSEENRRRMDSGKTLTREALEEL